MPNIFSLAAERVIGRSVPNSQRNTYIGLILETGKVFVCPTNTAFFACPVRVQKRALRQRKSTYMSIVFPYLVLDLYEVRFFPVDQERKHLGPICRVQLESK